MAPPLEIGPRETGPREAFAEPSPMDENRREGSHGIYNRFQGFLHTRLQHLVRLRRSDALQAADVWVIRAIDRAIYSTVVDCRKEGLDREVRELLGDPLSLGYKIGDSEIGLRQG